MGKKKSRKIGSYIRELSIVIIGVAVTLYTSNLISNIKERRETKAQLETIYDELKDNQQRIDKLIEFHEDHKLLQRFLFESMEKPSQAVNDSIEKYGYIIGKMPSFIYKKGAYETFLNSGTMKLINDRKLLIDITESYLMLETAKVEHDKYLAIKTQEVIKLYELNPAILHENLDLQSPTLYSIFNFYTSASGSGYYFDEAKQQIEKVLSRIPQ